MSETNLCPVCDGDGFLDHCGCCMHHAAFDCRDCKDESPCSLCGGSGRVSDETLAEYDRIMGVA